MNRFLLVLLGVITASKCNGNPTLNKADSSPAPDDNGEELVTEGNSDWSAIDDPYSLAAEEDSRGGKIPIVQKRSNYESLMRRSSLDKNFMRFGRSGFFPGERCCKQKDLIGFSSSWPSDNDPNELGKRSDDKNFMRFGRDISPDDNSDNFIRFGRGDKDNFMRFGRGDKDNFMRFGRGDKDNFMRFGRGDKDNFMRFGRGDKDNFMRFGRGDKDNFMRFGRGDKDNFMRFGRGDKDNFMRFGRREKDNFMRFGRGDKDNFMRFGKRDRDNFMRFGRGDKDNFMRFGKRDRDNFMRFVRGKDDLHNFDFLSDTQSENDEFPPNESSKILKRFNRNVKNPNNFLRFGKSNGKKDNFIRFGRSSGDRTGANGAESARHRRDEMEGRKEETGKDHVEENNDVNVLNADVNDDGLKNGPVVKKIKMTADGGGRFPTDAEAATDRTNEDSSTTPSPPGEGSLAPNVIHPDDSNDDSMQSSPPCSTSPLINPMQCTTLTRSLSSAEANHKQRQIEKSYIKFG